MTLFLVGFFTIFLLGLQQQHITYERHGWSALTCYALAYVQVMFVKEAGTTDLLGAFWFGTGSVIGSSLSIVVHRRFIRREAA